MPETGDSPTPADSPSLHGPGPLDGWVPFSASGHARRAGHSVREHEGEPWYCLDCPTRSVMYELLERVDGPVTGVDDRRSWRRARRSRADTVTAQQIDYRINRLPCDQPPKGPHR